MPEILIASDAATVRADVKGSLDDPATVVRELTRGAEVLPAVVHHQPDLVVLDLQIGKMGGMAVCLDLRLEEGAGRLGHVPVLMLLDRRADVFLARQSTADGWVLKPVDPIRLTRAIRALLGGGRFEDESLRPVTVPVPPREG
ncbi:MAG: response regulator [Acidimicrobiales bacterium]